jgi:hypothetical protein
MTVQQTIIPVIRDLTVKCEVTIGFQPNKVLMRGGAIYRANIVVIVERGSAKFALEGEACNRGE